MAKIKQVGAVSHSQAADVLEALGIKCPDGKTVAVNIECRISGTITKGEAYEQAATKRALSLVALGTILRHCGVTRQAAIAAVVAQCLESGADDYKADPRDESFADDLKAAIAAGLPADKCEGKRTGAVLVQPLQATITGQLSIDVAKTTVAA